MRKEHRPGRKSMRMDPPIGLKVQPFARSCAVQFSVVQSYRTADLGWHERSGPHIAIFSSAGGTAASLS